MVKINSTSRLFSITSEVILTQTDTTVGFLSQDEKRLQLIKKRPSCKHFIQVYKTFNTLKKANIRVPSSQKALVRRAIKSTFIIKNRAFRVVTDHLDSTLLRSKEWNYSSSANESGKNFERAFCEEKADIIIENKDALHEGTSSALYKINHKQRVRLR